MITQISKLKNEINIITIDPFKDPRWDKYVKQHPEGTLFHSSAWAKVLRDRYTTVPSYYAIENKNGEITAVAPFFLISDILQNRRLVCLPSSEYCFPLAGNVEDIIKLIDHVCREVKIKHISYVEIRGFSNEFQPEGLSLKSYPYYLSHVTTLSGNPQSFKSQLGRDTRYHICRAERSQITVRMARNEEDLKKFHKLTSLLRRRINLLPWPYRFFQSIYRHIIIPGDGFILLAEAGNKAISGGLFLNWNNTIMNKINASDPNFIQTRANYLVMWRAIEYAYEQSYRNFDFGITNPENKGLARFKKHWNTLETVLPYYYYPKARALNSVPETSLIYRAHTSINRFLPDFARNFAALLLYKRMG